MSSIVSNPYSFNISKNTEFSSQKLAKASRFECEFYITACEETVLAWNDYGYSLMSGYYKDFSYQDAPNDIFDLGSVNIININNNCSLGGCWAVKDMYANEKDYEVWARIKCPNIDKNDTSIRMKTYIMDSNNNIIEAETLTNPYYNNGFIEFFFHMDRSTFNIYNTIVASQNNPRYIKLYIE